MKRRNFLKAIGIGAVIAPAVVRADKPKQTLYVSNGTTEKYGHFPCPNGVLHFYMAGSTKLLETYQDKELTIPNCNPIQANSKGEFPPIYLKDHRRYDVTMSDPTGAWSSTYIGV